MLAEFRQHVEVVPLALETIFFGGGTPTLLSPAHLESLLSGLAEATDLSGLREWTLEANPATFDLKKAKRMRQLGVTRISLGVQSWQAETLKTLGRDHSPAEAETAFRILREAGFESVGIDLMFSVPGQTLDHWRADLDHILALRPDHVSAYNLTYEEDTEFLRRHERGELDTDEDRDANLFDLAIDTLEGAGYRHYEISNYALPGHESLHNQAYWNGADFLGIGPGAVSTVQGRRWKSLPDTAVWVSRVLAGESVETEVEALSATDRRIEAIALQLRTSLGVSAKTLLDGADPMAVKRVKSLTEEGYLETANNETQLRLSRKGRALADEVTAELI